MSELAKAALISIGTRRQGATVAPHVDRDALAELEWLGYVGKKGGLTRKGSIKRELIMDAELDAAFN